MLDFMMGLSHNTQYFFSMKKNKSIKPLPAFEKKQYRIALFFFIYCLTIVPLIRLNTLIDPALFSRFTALTIGLLVFVFLFLISHFQNRSLVSTLQIKSPVIAILLLYLLFSGLSIINAINQAEAVFDFLKNSVFAIFFLFSTVLLMNTKVTPAIITKTIVVFSSLIIVIGGVQLIEVFQQGALTKSSSNAVTAVFMNKNLFSQMLFLTAIFNLYGLVSLQKKWAQWCKINSLLILILLVVLITRSVWLAILVSFIFSIVFLTIYQHKKNEKLFVFRKKILRPIILIVSTILVAILIIGLSGGLNSEKGMLTREKFGSSTGRIAMWNSSTEMFLDYPFIGVGGGNWKINISKYGVYKQLKTTGKKRFQRPHNDYLTVITENGIFGFLAFISLLVLGLVYLIRIINLSQNKEEKLFYFFMLSGLVGYMSFSFFDFPGERVEHNIYLFFILSLAVAKYNSLKPDTVSKVSAKNFLLYSLPFIIILGIALVFGAKKLTGEMHTKKAIDAMHAKHFEITIDEISNNYSRFYEMDPTSTPVLWYKGLANFNLGNNKKALKNFLDAAEINPYHSHVLNSIGILYASVGNFDKAKTYFAKSLKLRPYVTETIINMAKIDVQDGQYDAAYQELRKVNPKNNKSAYKITIVKALEYQIDQLADSIQDEKIHIYILKLKESKPNTLEVYKTCYREGHSFKEQFLNQLAIDMLQNNSTLNPTQINTLNNFLIEEDN